MKNVIYSSKLENIFKDLSSGNTLDSGKYLSFKNNLTSINDIYKKEENYLTKFATNLNFRKNLIKKLPTNKFNQITDVVLGYISQQKINEMNKKMSSENNLKVTLKNLNLDFLNIEKNNKYKTIESIN